MEYYIEIGSSKIWANISDNANKDKPYICLCGGGPGIGDSLEEIDNLINSRFNVIRFEQRGCGRSTEDFNYTLETAIEDVEKIRQFYQIKTWYVLGHSWGANVALFYALKYTQSCDGVIYLGGMGIQNDNDWNEEFSENAKNLRQLEIDPPHINYDVLNMGLRSHNNYIKQPMLLRNIADLNIPVQVIYSKKDIRPMWPDVQLSNLLPNCNLVILENCNHFPWIQDAEKLKVVILNWIDSLTKLEQ